MQHLNDEELIAHHYHDADASGHLRICADCRTQYDTLGSVLALVDAVPVPDRDPEQIWNRLRWRLERRKRRTWQWIASVAAVLAIAFVTGAWWYGRQQTADSRQQAAALSNNPITQQPNNPVTTQPHNPETNKVLVYVVTDHLDAAERVLAEVANADPKKGFDAGEQQKRAEDLVDANRIYRQTASRRGDARIASLLSDIEPILVELSHSGAKLSPEQLTSMQKRIDSKNLLFKMRVMSAQGEEKQHNDNILASQHLNSL
jgi:hypothetical protein